GESVRSHRLPTTAQTPEVPCQSWHATAVQYHGGKLDGFVTATQEVDPGADPAVGMGYWTEEDLPFYYALARTFPLADRWFGSCLAQTYPNRRFLMAGTAAGIVSTSTQALTAPPPPNGNVFERLHAHRLTWPPSHADGLRWRDYYSDPPGVGVLLKSAPQHVDNLSPVDQFFPDAAAGTLPAVSLVDPNFETQSEENPQDIGRGEAFAARVINAVMA